MEQDGSELVKLDVYEQRLIRNYRKVNFSRQDTLIFFSDELVKLEIEENVPPPGNVLQLVRRK